MQDFIQVKAPRIRLARDFFFRSRFSLGLNVMKFPSCSFLQCSFMVAAIVVVAVVVNPWVFIPTLPLMVLFLYLRRYFLRTSRDIKRLEGTSRFQSYEAPQLLLKQQSIAL